MALSAAIMQPYFIPYAGYFRLFHAVDLFVIYDCVQFPRRGWVHRNQLPDRHGQSCWLTLPLAKAAREILIRDMTFIPEAQNLLVERLGRFPYLFDAPLELATLLAAIKAPTMYLVDYLVTTIVEITRLLDCSRPMIRSSSLEVPSEFRGQDRILEIARRVGATRYVNPPDGRALYDSALFREAGIELRFLSKYPGPAWSILWRLVDDAITGLSEEIRLTTVLEP